MTEQRYDVVVIGTGPGGEGTAMQSAKGGKRIAVIEAYEKFGGGCTHWGTIPSKAQQCPRDPWQGSADRCQHG